MIKHFPILGGKAHVVELSEGAIHPHINPQQTRLWWKYEKDTGGLSFKWCDLPAGNWQIVGRLSGMCECFVCGGDGKETCNNPDHGFLSFIGGVVGANESACPVCGHDENHKVPNGGDCECCDGVGAITVNRFIDACEEYEYDDYPVPPEPLESAILAEIPSIPNVENLLILKRI